MTVMELAAALGDAIADEAVVKELREAQAAYDACTAIQERLTEYNAQRKIMGDEFRKEVEKQDPDMLGLIKNRIDELGREIVSYPEYSRLLEAQKALQALMTKVNSEISYRVFGMRPEENSCTHDCSTCGGCH